MAMQKRAWMTTFLFKEFLSFFNKLVPGGNCKFSSYIIVLYQIYYKSNYFPSRFSQNLQLQLTK